MSSKVQKKLNPPNKIAAGPMKYKNKLKVSYALETV